MAHHEAVDVDPKALTNAERMWNNFAVAAKYGILAICGILGLLALAFVKFF